MNFGEMLEIIRNDPTKRAFRSGWNAVELGKECFIYVEPAKIIPNKVLREPIKSWLIGKDMDVQPHFVNVMDGKISEWMPSRYDIFAEDWWVKI